MVAPMGSTNPAAFFDAPDTSVTAFIVKGRVTATINADLIKLANINGFKFAQLLEFAIQFQLAEKSPHEHEYPENVLKQKVHALTPKLSEALEELHDLKEKFKDQLEEDHEKEVEGELKDAGL